MIETLVDWQTTDYQAIVNMTDHWLNHASTRWSNLSANEIYNQIFNGYLKDCELKNLG